VDGVIKFENPQGDATRGQLRDVPNADSLYFTMPTAASGRLR
jgi:formyl-CoA transferase